MNPNPYDPAVLRQQMTRLRVAADERQRLEQEISAEHEGAVSEARSVARRATQEAERTHDREAAVLRKEHAAVAAKAEAEFAADSGKLAADLKTRMATIRRQWEQQENQLKDDTHFAMVSAKEVYLEKRKEPAAFMRRAEKDIAAVNGQLDKAEKQLDDFVSRLALPAVQPPEPVAPDSQAAERLDQARAAVAELAAGLSGRTPTFVFSSMARLVAVLVPAGVGGLAALATYLGAPLDDSLRLPTAAAVFGVVALVGGALGYWLVNRLRRSARDRTAALQVQLRTALADARMCVAAATTAAQTRHDTLAAALEKKFADDSRDRTEKAVRDVKQAAAKRDERLAELERRYEEAIGKLTARRDSRLQAATEKYPPALEALASSRQGRLAEIARMCDERIAAADSRRDDRWSAMTEAWRTARSQTGDVYDAAARIDSESFRSWDDLQREDVALPANAPPGLRFGRIALSLAAVPGGLSTRAELNSFGPAAWIQPATLPFPVDASLLIKTSADQKEVASEMMQALMLRIASGIPAGQSRFTIIDPLGLGKQFAGFMHLADYDELLVTSRIWTEPPQIEQCLADITEHIELVIQKYLRNEYESIGAYNMAAEVPEPYRFVVIANFPANFTETAARRLASIASSGARCGVYTILSVDTSQNMPANFAIGDIVKHATTLSLKDGTFTWSDPEFGRWPLTVEQPPSDEVFTRIIQRVGKAAKAAKRVEVPFDRVAPADENWWTGSTSSEVLAPLGPAGANKLQYFKLGKGTSQHALIAGKTGSGKSTLMHALITSLALNYSPDEIQFYLIDFKKGVEFKLYDQYRLPHARVIAIESEREFGLSVLEQLDRELKHRGDLFRQHAVQDMAGFRAAGTGLPMPRILLVIDEFQEIFVEDDKIAQDASLILDRLVRQGRAFGMHVILGSQTLGGSYSLPRATMGQMAVRIALQCNEADSSLILSEDNTAARLLTRPGEAIYNDANGMIAGNSPFQVVFLNDERRERYLGSLRKLADRRTDIPTLPRIVFDGNEAAEPRGNALLAELLRSGTVGGRPPVAPQAWLGDAIAIKDPTAATFRRQGGANLLIVGQREDLGVSLLAMSMVSLAASHDPHPAGAMGKPGRFVLLEPAIADEKPDILLARIGPSLPHETTIVGRLGVAAAIDALADEVRRRIEEQVLDGEAVFVILRDLARFRELRRNENDFGFSGMGGDTKATPAQNLVTLLKDGPPVGVHVLIWCDSFTNLQRTFERGTLKEFELRVIFQMSGADSSQLVDSPSAVKLGPQRALFVHEETGTLEKFRPYAFPADEWLAEVSATLRARPQGTPVERPIASASPATAAPKPAETGGEFGFSFQGGFGDDDFNFAKMLDSEPPSGGPPEDRPRGESAPG